MTNAIQIAAFAIAAKRTALASTLVSSISNTGINRSARKNIAQSPSTAQGYVRRSQRRPTRGAEPRIRAVTVRAATPDDAHAIERVRTDTWRAAYRGLMPDEVLERLGYDGTRRRESMQRMPADRFALVAEHDGEVVGFVNGGASRDGDPADSGEVYAIYVLPSHQGHGHGAALLRAAAREIVARGWRGMMLWVLRDNGPSRVFYERMGG